MIQTPAEAIGRVLLAAHGIDEDQITDVVVETSREGSHVLVQMKPDAQEVDISIVLCDQSDNRRAA